MRHTPFRRTRDLLLVEDNPADIRLVEEALAHGETASRLHVARDGEEALRFLRRQPPHLEAGPDVILLDLDLPGRDGHEVLAAVKGDASLSSIPEIVFTRSRREEDVLRAYRLRANAY